jgi:hypothetical protein
LAQIQVLRRICWLLDSLQLEFAIEIQLGVQKWLVFLLQFDTHSEVVKVIFHSAELKPVLNFHHSKQGSSFFNFLNCIFEVNDRGCFMKIKMQMNILISKAGET